jgi:hypothetical protein
MEKYFITQSELLQRKNIEWDYAHELQQLKYTLIEIVKQKQNIQVR